jgi:hypothetical protein
MRKGSHTKPGMIGVLVAKRSGIDSQGSYLTVRSPGSTSNVTMEAKRWWRCALDHTAISGGGISQHRSNQRLAIARWIAARMLQH